MAKKIMYSALIIIGVVGAYIIMLATQSTYNELISTANTSISATSNMSNYPGTLDFINSSPFWIWFIPGGVGTVALIVMLKTGDSR